MTEPRTGRDTIYPDDKAISLLALVSALVRWRWMIISLGLLGAAVGLASGLMTTRLYRSSATFVPQDAEQSTSNLAEMASQFGIRVPTAASTTAWGTSMYVKLLRSRALLEPIVHDTLVVAEQGNRRVSVMDLLKVEEATPERRADRAVRLLQSVVSASEDRRLGTVELAVTTQWPSVSVALAERLIERLNEFNLETRKSQAAAERKFVEAQASEEERALREAEDRLLSFLQRNRATLAPELAFQRERLQREVTLRQQLYSSWLQNREQARIREVRDTPVITVIEPPRLPLVGEARRSVRKGILGGLAGGLIGVILALAANALANARRAPSPDTLEFFQVVKQATPRFLRRRQS